MRSQLLEKRQQKIRTTNETWRNGAIGSAAIYLAAPKNWNGGGIIIMELFSSMKWGGTRGIAISV